VLGVSDLLPSFCGSGVKLGIESLICLGCNTNVLPALSASSEGDWDISRPMLFGLVGSVISIVEGNDSV
jgi:hypothetical protein